ncbi:MAG: hypothetical protein H7A25_17955 [Leptospiraceae bacterium]|nr:hypothetical protein [Leptospiraceae bacterium]MCP5501793.1 hypothetical protein [Leptospiraceae bacterium]
MKQFIYLLTLLSLFSCGSILQKEYPKKKYFILEASKEKVPQYPEKFRTLKVINFRTSSLFEPKGFVYKYQDISYEIDFYNEFLINPNQIFTEETGNYLMATGLVKNLANHSRMISSEFFLEGYISELSGEFIEENSPKASIGLDFYLLRSEDNKIFFHKKYISKVPFKEKNPELLVKAWNEALTKILKEFAADLNKKELPIPKKEL